MEHYPLGNSDLLIIRVADLVQKEATHDTLLRLIERRQLCQHGIIVVCHTATGVDWAGRVEVADKQTSSVVFRGVSICLLEVNCVCAR